MTLPGQHASDLVVEGARDAAAMADLDRRLAAQERESRFSVGISPSFTWSGSNRTTITVNHNLGRVPVAVISSSADHADNVAGDARTPWLTTTGNYTATTFDICFATKNDAVIGTFSVSAGMCSWLAF